MSEESRVSLEVLEKKRSSVILLYVESCLAKLSTVNIRTDLAFIGPENTKSLFWDKTNKTQQYTCQFV